MSHLKRLAAPKTWDIVRKGKKFTAKTSPGPHKEEYSLPLVVLLRDTLGIVSTEKECKKVLRDGLVLVNGKKRAEKKFAVGLMDCVEIPLEKKAYRMSINKRGILYPEEAEPAKERLARIEGKTVIKKGKVQLNLFGGDNITVDKDEYKIGDVVKLSFKDHKIAGTIVLSNGIPALIIGGSHVGVIATIKGLDKSITPAEAILEDEDKKEIRTRLYNVYPIEG